MKGKTHSIYNFTFVITVFLLIIYAWINDNLKSAITAGSIYILKLLIDNIDLIITARNHKNGIATEGSKNKLDYITQVIETILVIGSLFAMAPKDDLYRIPANMIWFGQVASYILVGPIIGIFADIPMKMTYGGWSPKRKLRK